jgi:hypothetical protein
MVASRVEVAVTEQPPNYPPPTPDGYGYQPPNYPPPAPGGYGYGYPPPMYSAPRTNALAIASLVASIAGLFTCGIGNILGLIFGVVGLSQIKRTGEGGRGLAIAGIVISVLTFVLLVVAFIIGTVNRHDREDDNYSSQHAVVSVEELAAPAELISCR